VLVAIAIAAFAALPLAGRSAGADSLWQRRRPAAALLYRDNVAVDIGDSLTVLIEDQSSFTKKGERELEKTTEHTAELNLKTSVVDLVWPMGNAEQSSSRKFEGTDDYSSSRAFTRLARPSMFSVPITLVLVVLTGLTW
jgi:flagellar basal body L-ring protein FlgH